MSLALYTTIYPGVERYLPDWYRSVQEQTDSNFQLWIGLDAVEIEAAKDAIGEDPQATWVPAVVGDTPAQVRQRALAQIVKSSTGVVLVDSDDVLHPSRIAAARAALRAHELAGCALRLVDQRCRDLGRTIGLPLQAAPEDVLPRNNIFGFSNTAYRSDLLGRCLPIPAHAVLVDWFLATRAWLCGARLGFDPEVRMDYRQHEANTARVRSPFTASQVREDADLVRQHFQILETSPMAEAVPGRLASTARIATDVEAFYREVVLEPEKLDHYVRSLNALEMAPVWWSSVAHPSLQYMWTSTKETR